MKRRGLLATIPSATILAGCSAINGDSYNQPAQYGEVKHLTVVNQMNESINATVVIRDTDAESVLSETNITAPKREGEEGRGMGSYAEKSIPTADESGNYVAEITIEGRGTVTTEFNLRTPVSGPVLYIDRSNGANESFSAGVDGAPDV